MCRETSVVLLQDMMDDFLTPATNGSKMVPNIFTDVPDFISEKEMYDYITECLSGSEELCRAGMTFMTFKRDTRQQAIICGTYPSGSVLKEECTASNEGRHLSWALTDLLVACKINSVTEDPFNESSIDNESTAIESREVLDQILSHVDLVFKYQQRTFVFVVLFLGPCARVLRFDRSGIVATKKIDYTTPDGGTHLSQFFVGHLEATDRGHDPTASRISPSDPIGRQLKELGAAAAKKNSEDYVQRLFNESIDEEWPWWKLSVPCERRGGERCFAVGKPHFYAGGVIGRGTRGYVAAPLGNDGMIDPNAKFVYLKDTWRVDHEGTEIEGTVLKTLNDVQVPYVPTVLCHGDLGQSTLSYNKWPDYHGTKTRDACPLKSHQHYRLVVAEVCKPLSEFENSFQLVWALFCCITAHEQACAVGYIHRDISAGNILLYRDAAGRWAGLLNDWELSKECVDGETQDSSPQLDRTGTWQFMSVHVLLAKSKLAEIPDDLESFFHVLIYFAVRFLPHNLADELVETFLYNYFDDYTDGYDGFNCGPTKYNAVKRGVIDLTTITSFGAANNETQKVRPLEFFMPPSATPSCSDGTATENCQSLSAKTGHPINKLINELLKAFQAFYAKDDVEKVETGAVSDPFGIPPEVLDAAVALKKSRAGVAKDVAASSAEPASSNDGPTATTTSLAAKVETHGAMREIIMDHLVRSAWPKLDKGNDKKPKGGYVPAKEDTIVGSTIPTGSKRRAEEGEQSMSKRVRSRAA
ncbi:hypothetical protein GSI_04031 [Ganoderma sinense ZZ0214-1]|uniref:Fungal-type protein kinase domain-containing protein n=1 Tax=Ganoderma sinense ZZ0214-1 TaxID=1077348 RepID=A0A2G8SI13_9APHY|nr:hypothetical protein GSI_04031 [Ganoderma sinense ZZ0214-1]